jgi:hypothetical protein
MVHPYTLNKVMQSVTCIQHFTYTVKKGLRFSSPQPGCHLPNTLWAEIIKLFPARKSLVSDIPAEEGKTANLFLQCTNCTCGEL